jgi:putative solute:sodium symporter small subunit
MAIRPDIREHWRRSKRLTFELLAIWFIVSFVIPFFARALTPITFFGWPLPFYMAAQGALVVYVVIIGIYAARMRRLDRQFGLGEEGRG